MLKHLDFIGGGGGFAGKAGGFFVSRGTVVYRAILAIFIGMGSFGWNFRTGKDEGLRTYRSIVI